MALTDPLQWVVVSVVFIIVIAVIVVVFFLWTMNKAAKAPTSNSPGVQQGSANSPEDYTSEGLTGIVDFAIGGTLLLYAFFWITSDLGNNDPVGGLVEYGLAFFSLLLIGAGLHGILRSSTH